MTAAPDVLEPDDVIAAIRNGTLADVAVAGSAAHETCLRIQESATRSAEQAMQWLSEGGVAAERIEQSTLAHQFWLAIDPGDRAQAYEILEAQGYERWVQLSGGALRCHEEINQSMLLIKPGATQTRVMLRWGERRSMRWHVRPTLEDLSTVELPEFAWRAYFGLRPLKLVVDRLRKAGPEPERRPFLGTPASLMTPLFDVAELGPDDVFVDVGCGDGRVVIEAARSIGCRAIGIEYAPDIAATARVAVDEAGVCNLVTIVEGDARAVDLSSATVVFVFLPQTMLQALLPSLLAGSAPGARVVAHEQLELKGLPTPTRVAPVIGTDAVSVANLWVSPS